MVWYGMVTLFKHGISFRYTFIEKTNFLTSLKTKIKEIKLIKMKRKHLLFKEAVCKNRISLVKLFIKHVRKNVFCSRNTKYGLASVAFQCAELLNRKHVLGPSKPLLRKLLVLLYLTVGK